MSPLKGVRPATEREYLVVAFPKVRVQMVLRHWILTVNLGVEKPMRHRIN